MEIDLSALDAVMGPPAHEDPGSLPGAPLSLPVTMIDEDPDQPRTEFDEQSLGELAATIAERGVRQPISVRSHPGQPGRWMLNFGARRLRASKLAGRAVIPAFVDETADTYDQVVENEQRQGLQPLELALFIARRLRAGDSQADVARRLGKSRMYVTYLCTLIDAPDWLMTIYRTGKCRGVAELHELARLRETAGPVLESWASARATITRTDVREFKLQLADSGIVDTSPAVASAARLKGDPHTSPEQAASGINIVGYANEPVSTVPQMAPHQAPSAGKAPRSERTDHVADRASGVVGRPTLVALWRHEEVELVLDMVPQDAGHFFIRGLKGAEQQRQQQQVMASELTLLRFDAKARIASS